MKKKISLYVKTFFTKPEYVFVVPALIFGIISAVLLPQLIANDENMHFIRSYQLSDLGVKNTCSIPVDIKERGFFAIYTKDKPDFTFDTDPVDMNDQMETDCGTATTYNPVLHFPQTIGVVAAKAFATTTGVMILLGRLANVLFYCAALFFIIRKTRIGKWPLAVLGLLPMMVHISGTLSGDVVNNVIIFTFITYVLNLFTQKKHMSKKQILVLFVLSGLLAVTKMTNLVLLLPLLFLPRQVIPTYSILGKKMPKWATRLLLGAVSGVVAIGVLGAWSLLYGSSVAAGVQVTNPVQEQPLLFLSILFNTYINPDTIYHGVAFGDWLYRGFVGSFASFRYHLPFGMVMLLTCLLLIVSFRKDATEEHMLKKGAVPLVVSMVGAFVLAVLAMTYGLYVAWAIKPEVLGEGALFAAGLQGRYFTPLVLLLLPAVILLRKYVSVNVKSDVTMGVLVFLVTTFALTYYIVQTIVYTAAM